MTVWPSRFGNLSSETSDRWRQTFLTLVPRTTSSLYTSWAYRGQKTFSKGWISNFRKKEIAARSFDLRTLLRRVIEANSRKKRQFFFMVCKKFHTKYFIAPQGVVESSGCPLTNPLSRLEFGAVLHEYHDPEMTVHWFYWVII